MRRPHRTCQSHHPWRKKIEQVDITSPNQMEVRKKKFLIPKDVHLAPAARCRGLLGSDTRRGRGCAGVRSRQRRLGGGDLLLALAKSLCGGRVPVPGHLQSEHGIQDEACHEAVQNQLVVHLLEGGENPDERASEIVEDLPNAEVRDASCMANREAARSGTQSFRLISSLFSELEHIGAFLQHALQGPRVPSHDGKVACENSKESFTGLRSEAVKWG